MSERAFKTANGHTFDGLTPLKPIASVSILRSGESMEYALRQVVRDLRMGKILIQRDESKPNKPPRFFFSKLPSHLDTCTVLLLDPMLATGQSAIHAINLLKQESVTEESIVMCALVSAADGVTALLNAFPSIQLVTSMIDPRLDAHKFIVPGLGDFGDRYFGT